MAGRCEQMQQAAAARTAPGITFYGAPWCGDSRRSRRLLDQLQIPYTFVDVDADPGAAAWVRSQNDGFQSIPMLVLAPTGQLLVEPTDDEVLEALATAGITAAS